jgi:hypothetical protein
MVTIELARTLGDFDDAVRGRREAVRVALQIDFAFIAAYWLVFATTSALFATRGLRAADPLPAGRRHPCHARCARRREGEHVHAAAVAPQ